MARDRSAYREQKRAIDRRYYAANKERFAARNKKAQQECREIVLAAKAVPCADCERCYPSYVMDFDHREGADKEFTIGHYWQRGSKQKLLAEIEKCDVVCANCHRERTAQRSGLV